MPESVIREELEFLEIRVQVSRSCDPDVATRTLQRTAFPPHFIVSVARGPEVSKVRSLTEIYDLRLSVVLYVAPKGPMQCKRN